MFDNQQKKTIVSAVELAGFGYSRIFDGMNFAIFLNRLWIIDDAASVLMKFYLP